MQQDLADAVEHVRVRRQPGIGRVLGQDPVAEAVEVADRHAAGGRRRRQRLRCGPELRRGLDVVGQDQDLLRDEVLVRSRRRDPLDDDLGLAGPAPAMTTSRPLAPLDDPPLLVGERTAGSASGGSSDEPWMSGRPAVLAIPPTSIREVSVPTDPSVRAIPFLHLREENQAESWSRRTSMCGSGDGDAVYWLSPVRLRERQGYTPREVERVRRLVEANRELLLRRWHEFFDQSP